MGGSQSSCLYKFTIPSKFAGRFSRLVAQGPVLSRWPADLLAKLATLRSLRSTRLDCREGRSATMSNKPWWAGVAQSVTSVVTQATQVAGEVWTEVANVVAPPPDESSSSKTQANSYNVSGRSCAHIRYIIV